MGAGQSDSAPNSGIAHRLAELERGHEELMGLVTALTAVSTALAATHPQRALLLEALERAAPGVRQATQAHGVSERTQMVLEAFTNLLHQTLTEPVPSQFAEANDALRTILKNPPRDTGN